VGCNKIGHLQRLACGRLVDTREFGDVAAHAARVIRGQNAFEKIYLLQALEPGLEAYEIYPACVRCA
jgi:hypothetical protein